MKVLSARVDDTTVDFLRSCGIVVEKQEVEDADDLAAWLESGEYDAAIIDLEASKLGIYVCRGLRTKGIKACIIGVSKGSDERVWSEHRSIFLENGGDDLLRGPVSPRELVATLRATGRRYKGSLLDIYEYRAGDVSLKVNLTTKSVAVNGVQPHLTGKETAMMLMFASSPGRVLSKEMILMQMYTDGVDDQPELKIIDVFVCKLRRKLSEIHEDAGKFLETVWGRGYMLPTQTQLDKPRIPASTAA